MSGFIIVVDLSVEIASAEEFLTVDADVLLLRLCLDWRYYISLLNRIWCWRVASELAEVLESVLVEALELVEKFSVYCLILLP